MILKRRKFYVDARNRLHMKTYRRFPFFKKQFRVKDVVIFVSVNCPNCGKDKNGHLGEFILENINELRS